MRGAFLVLVVAACQNRSPLDGAVAASGSSKPAAKPSDVEARLARVERKLAKVTAALDVALPPADPDPTITYAVAIDPRDPVRGPADARITIVELCDFLAMGCYLVQPVVDQLLTTHPRDVRVVTKYLVAHGQPSVAPGEALCGANMQGKADQLARALWARYVVRDGGQPRIATERLSAATIDAAAAEVGIDVARLHADGASQPCIEWLRATDAAMQALGATVVPAFFINGRFLGGAPPIELFAPVIRQELERVDRAIAAGVPAADYYAREFVGKGEKRVKGRFEE